MSAVLIYLANNWKRLSLEQFGDPTDLSYIVATPRFRSSSHLVFFVLNGRKADPVLIIKVPRIANDYDRLSREESNLRLLHEKTEGGIDSVPRIIAFEEYEDIRMLVETALPGHKMSSRMKQRPPKSSAEIVVPWLTELHMATREHNPGDSDWFERLIERPFDHIKESIPLSTREVTLMKQTQTVAEQFRDQDLPLVFEHGDLAPPNILLSDKGGIGVVDWELAVPEGLPAVDLFFFLTVAGFSWRGARNNNDYLEVFHETFFEPSAWALGYIRYYAERLELSRDILNGLFILCWSRYVSAIVQRLHEVKTSNGSIADETLQWLRSNRYYMLWRHAIEHYEELNLVEN